MEKITDYREYAKSHYLVSTVTEQMFETDIQLMTRVNTSIKRIMSGTNNVRLVMNQITTWFNLFERDAAIIMLMARADENNKSALITILDLMGYLPFYETNLSSKYPLEPRVAGLILTELGVRYGKVCVRHR